MLTAMTPGMSTPMSMITITTSGPGLAARLRHMLRPHSHEAADQVDAVMEGSAEGMRVLWISLGMLGRDRADPGRGDRAVRVGGAAG